MKIKGIGYNAKPNQTTKWIWPGGASAGETPFNPSAPNPFGTGPGGVLDQDDFDLRYGKRPVREDGTIANLSVDAETIFEAGTRAMQLAVDRGLQFGDGYTGSFITHDMKVSILDAHDFAATNPNGLKKLMSDMGVGGGSNVVVIPAPLITKISSPTPGKILLSWRTRLEPYGFEVDVWNPDANSLTSITVDLGIMPANRSARTALFDVPKEILGSAHKKRDVGVYIRSYLAHDSRKEYGPWSTSGFVKVEPVLNPEPEPVPEPTPPIPDPEPNPNPNPIPVPTPLSPLPQRVDELWSWVNTTLWPLARPVAIEILGLFREVMARWKDR